MKVKLRFNRTLAVNISIPQVCRWSWWYRYLQYTNYSQCWALHQDASMNLLWSCTRNLVEIILARTMMLMSINVYQNLCLAPLFQIKFYQSIPIKVIKSEYKKNIKLRVIYPIYLYSAHVPKNLLTKQGRLSNRVISLKFLKSYLIKRFISKLKIMSNTRIRIWIVMFDYGLFDLQIGSKMWRLQNSERRRFWLR